MKSKDFWQPLLTAGAIALGIRLFCCDIAKRKSKTPKSGISKSEVFEAQCQWGDSLVNIGAVYSSGGNYKEAAMAHIERFYAYDSGVVLFKPTMAVHKQFRTDKESALSYFVGGNNAFAEDHGFALKPWKKVRWENIGTTVKGNLALAMGNYYFTPANDGNEVKVEYSFAYIKDKSGQLRIILHDSHLPCHCK
jgi:hypothetical protein